MLKYLKELYNNCRYPSLVGKQVTVLGMTFLVIHEDEFSVWVFDAYFHCGHTTFSKDLEIVCE